MRGERVLWLTFVLMILGSLPTEPENPIAPPGIRGSYVGLEEIKDYDPEHPQAKWYHENTLFVRDGELVLDKSPVVIENGHKEYSASDGGFLTYRGRILRRQSELLVALRLFASDYVIFREGPAECEPYSRITVFPVVIRNGEILLDGVRYIRKPIPKDKEDWWLRVLADESLEHARKPYRSDMREPACPVPVELARP